MLCFIIATYEFSPSALPWLISFYARQHADGGSYDSAVASGEIQRFVEAATSNPAPSPVQFVDVAQQAGLNSP